MADVERDAALAGVLVVELAAHVGIGHALERGGGLHARLATADRRHGGEPRVGMALELDLEAFGAKRAQKPRPAGGCQEPREIEHANAVKRERLSARRRLAGVRHRGLRVDRWRAARYRAVDRGGVLVEAWRAPPRRPAGGRADPLRRRIAERLAELGMLDIGDAAALDPVGVERVLVRLAQRRPQHSRLLCLAPGDVLVGERAHEARHGLHRLVAARLVGCGAWHEAADARRFRGLFVESRFDAVRLHQSDQLLAVVRPIAEVRHHPAAVLGMRDRRMRRHALARVPASLAEDRGAPHDPGHQVDLGALGHRLVHGAGHVLALAGAVAVHERRQDRHAHLLAGDVIGVPHLRRDRRQVVLAARRRVVAAVHHHAAERQMNEVAALVVAPRPLVAERRDASMDQRRVPPGKSVFAEADRFEPTLRRRLEQDVGLSQKRLELLAIRPPHRDRARPSVCRDCIARRTASLQGPACPGRTARCGVSGCRLAARP